MAEFNWVEMMEGMQDIRLFCSLHVRRAKKGEMLSAQELDLLSRVALAQHKLTPHELSSNMGISKSVLSRLIDHLELKGLLDRENDSRDKRSYFLNITELGRTEIESLYAYYLKPIYQLRRHVGEESFAELIRIIRQSNEAMKEEQGDI